MLGIDRLNRIDNDEIRFQLLHLLKDGLCARLRIEIAILILDANPIRPHFDLLDAFLPRYIEYLERLKGESNLKEQGGLPYPWLPSDEDDRAGHDSPSQYPIEFGIIGDEPRQFIFLNFIELDGFGLDRKILEGRLIRI